MGAAALKPVGMRKGYVITTTSAGAPKHHAMSGECLSWLIGFVNMICCSLSTCFFIS